MIATNTVQLISASASLATAVGILLTVLLALKNGSKMDAVHEEIKTGNTNTMGMLAVQDEGRRIETKVPHDERTTNQQHYVDQVPAEPKGESNG